MTDNVSTLPDQSIVLDLDTLERDQKEVKAPFKVKLAGKVITFVDPAEIPWQDLASLEEPTDLFNVALSYEDRKHLRSSEVPGWKFNQLMEAYFLHYDFEEKLRNAKRAAQFGA